MYVHFKNKFQVSLFHNFIVLSFSNAADAIILAVGWHDVHKTTSEKLIWISKKLNDIN